MRIFLSYASEDRELAEEVQLALSGSGHRVFFDKASLPAGGDYHARIAKAVASADLFVFLVSPNSVASGSYALTELKFARQKWPHPKERILPVWLHPVEWEEIPPYLKSVTVLQPDGNIAAETNAAVSEMIKSIGEPNTASDARLAAEHDTLPVDPRSNSVARNKKKIRAAILLVVIASTIVLILLWPRELAELPHGGLRGPDPLISDSPAPNTECSDITVYDYSKSPPESKVVKYCEP